jgi:hypothetical protein
VPSDGDVLANGRDEQGDPRDMEDVEADVFASRDGGALNDDVVRKVVKLMNDGTFSSVLQKIIKGMVGKYRRCIDPLFSL